MYERLGHMLLPINMDKTLGFLISSRVKNKNILNTASMLGKRFYQLWKYYGFSKMPKRNLEVDVEECSKLNEDVDYFWERYSKENKCVTIKRDKKYLQWRFLSNPVIPHRIFISRRNETITGYIVVNLVKDGDYMKGNIVDILSLKRQKEDMVFLIQKAISYFNENRADFAMTWISYAGLKFYRNAFTSNGFFSLPSTYLDVIVRPSPTLTKQRSVLGESNWYITMAFTEGVS